MSYLTLAEHVAETLDVGPGTRIFEVDCGDGAFLSPFFANGFIVGGIDGNAGAIASAAQAMPEGVFQVGIATALDPAVPWDVVVCRSLAAAPDSDYLRGVIARMFAKSTHAIALLEVPDERRQWMLRALAEIGASAIQFEEAGQDRPLCHVFARNGR